MRRAHRALGGNIASADVMDPEAGPLAPRNSAAEKRIDAEEAAPTVADNHRWRAAARIPACKRLRIEYLRPARAPRLIGRGHIEAGSTSSPESSSSSAPPA